MQKKEGKGFEARIAPFGSVQGPNSQKGAMCPTCFSLDEDRRPMQFLKEPQ